jgi:hypothetical protein
MMTPQNIAEEPRVHDNEVRFFRMPDLPAFTSHYLSVPETPSSKPFLLTAAEDDSFCTYNSTSIDFLNFSRIANVTHTTVRHSLGLNAFVVDCF